jgi:hypothetical protein
MTTTKKIHWVIIFAVLLTFTGLSTLSILNPYRLGAEIAFAAALEDEGSVVLLSHNSFRPSIPEIKNEFGSKPVSFVSCRPQHTPFLAELSNVLGQNQSASLVLNQQAKQDEKVLNTLGQDSQFLDLICNKIEFVVKIPIISVFHVS